MADRIDPRTGFTLPDPVAAIIRELVWLDMAYPIATRASRTPTTVSDSRAAGGRGEEAKQG